MLTYSLAGNSVRPAGFSNPSSAVFEPPIDQDRQGSHSPPRLTIGQASGQTLRISPAGNVRRRTIGWDGMRVEFVQFVTQDQVELRFNAPCHLLLVYKEGVRGKRETLAADLPVSPQGSLTRKLTFVPAGHEYHEWQRVRIGGAILCFYLDPARMPMHPDPSPMALPPAPRLYFENGALWETAMKLGAAIEDGFATNERYCEALGLVLAHELASLEADARRRRDAPARGGLALWQQRAVAAYIEEHLGEPIPLAALAKLVRLSSYYFCRAFKRSFGVPPHRFHINRRIERAKALLANPARSVTDIAIALGFSETSSFSTAFRQSTGKAPTQYRRRLA